MILGALGTKKGKVCSKNGEKDKTVSFLGHEMR